MAWLTNPLAVVDAMVTSGEQVDVEAWFAERIEAHFQQVRRRLQIIHIGGSLRTNGL